MPLAKSAQHRKHPFARRFRRQYYDIYGAQCKFDVKTGKVVTRPKVVFFHPKMKDVPSYQIKVEDENIMVKL
jgi:hypothetical protein